MNQRASKLPEQPRTNGASALLWVICAHTSLNRSKRLGTRIAQTHAGICEFEAAPFLDEQADPQMFFQHFKLAAHGAMGDVQLLSRLAHAVEAGRGFEGAQGVKGREVSAHL